MVETGRTGMLAPLTSPGGGRRWWRTPLGRLGAAAVAAVLLASCAASPEGDLDPVAREPDGRLIGPPPDLGPIEDEQLPERGDPGGPPPTTTQPEVVTFRQAQTLAQIGGCEIFPPEHYLNATNVDRLDVHPMSSTWLGSLGDQDVRLRFANSLVWNGHRDGMPLNIVDSREVGFSPVRINWNYTSLSYPGPYPVPPNPMVEGYPGVWFDAHMIMIDVADCTVYETIGYNPQAYRWFGVHTALAGAKYSLDTVEWPVLTTNAPSTPMVGQYVQRDEVAQGLVPHVLAFCSNQISTQHVWPARASDGTRTDPEAMPMGAWIRLADHVDPASFTGDARPVAEALRRHGAVLTDYCGHPFRLRMESSGTWNDAEMDPLRQLAPSDFVVVDPSPMIVDPTTWEIR